MTSVYCQYITVGEKTSPHAHIDLLKKYCEDIEKCRQNPTRPTFTFSAVLARFAPEKSGQVDWLMESTELLEQIGTDCRDYFKLGYSAYEALDDFCALAFPSDYVCVALVRTAWRLNRQDVPLDSDFVELAELVQKSQSLMHRAHVETCCYLPLPQSLIPCRLGGPNRMFLSDQIEPSIARYGLPVPICADRRSGPVFVVLVKSDVLTKCIYAIAGSSAPLAGLGELFAKKIAPVLSTAIAVGFCDTDGSRLLETERVDELVVQMNALVSRIVKATVLRICLGTGQFGEKYSDVWAVLLLALTSAFGAWPSSDRDTLHDRPKVLFGGKRSFGPRTPRAVSGPLVLPGRSTTHLAWTELRNIEANPAKMGVASAIIGDPSIDAFINDRVAPVWSTELSRLVTVPSEPSPSRIARSGQESSFHWVHTDHSPVAFTVDTPIVRPADAHVFLDYELRPPTYMVVERVAPQIPARSATQARGQVTANSGQGNVRGGPQAAENMPVNAQTNIAGNPPAQLGPTLLDESSSQLRPTLLDEPSSQQRVAGVEGPPQQRRVAPAGNQSRHGNGPVNARTNTVDRIDSPGTENSFEAFIASFEREYEQAESRASAMQAGWMARRQAPQDQPVPQQFDPFFRLFDMSPET